MKTKRENSIPQDGEVFQHSYPFVRTTHTEWDDEGSAEVPTWKPGVSREGEGTAYADGIGGQIVTVISTHKPGRYPMRVFFTRKWRDPSGKVFGKTACRVLSLQAFRTLVGGFRHPFELDGASDVPRYPEIGKEPFNPSPKDLAEAWDGLV